MSNHSPMTELEAVNMMLRGIGESPVSTLEVSGLVDVGIAKSILHDTSRDIQQEGWNFNTEVEYPLTPTVPDGNLTPPSNALKLWPALRYTDIDPVQRGTNLYDRKNRTYVFTQQYKFNMVLYLDWTDLPQAARQLVSMLATKRMQQRMLGSDTLDGFTDDDLLAARVTLKDADGETANYNILTGSTAAREVLERWI